MSEVIRTLETGEEVLFEDSGFILGMSDDGRMEVRLDSDPKKHVLMNYALFEKAGITSYFMSFTYRLIKTDEGIKHVISPGEEAHAGNVEISPHLEELQALQNEIAHDILGTVR